jgi:putative membrane protein
LHNDTWRAVMQKIFLWMAIAILAVTMGCNKQRGSEQSSEGKGSGSDTSATGGSSAGQGQEQAQTDMGKSMGGPDQQFVQQAAQGGIAEVDLSTMVADKTTNPTVKQLAQRIVRDHTNANQQLQSAVQQANGTMPTTPSSDAQQMRDQMSTMSGRELDRAYVQHLIQDHEKDISLFQQEANNGTDPQLKTFAQKTLPTLKEHLQLAKAAQSKLRG